MPSKAGYVLSPGDIFAEWLAVDCGATKKQGADVLCMMPDRAHRFYAGQERMTGILAKSLERITGIDCRVWVALDRAYTRGLAAGKVRKAFVRGATSHGRRTSLV